MANTLIKDLNNLLSGSVSYDLKIIVGEPPHEKTFEAHSLMLQARSPYFNRALSATWAKKDSDGKLLFEKPNISPGVFGIILEYLYTDVISWENIEAHICEILQAADELQLNDFLTYIQDELTTNHETYLNNNFVTFFYITSTLDSCLKLRQHLKQTAANYPEFYFGAQDFTKLEHGDLKSLLQNRGLAIPEIDIWDKVIEWGIANTIDLTSTTVDSWTKTDFLKLGGTLRDLLPLIRYISIESTDFYHKVLPYKKALPKELFNEILRFYLDKGYEPVKGNLHPARQLVDSKMVDNRQVKLIIKQIKSSQGGSSEDEVDLNLVYRGSRDGFMPVDFHRLCDNKGPTVTVIKSGASELLGGYSPFDWNGDNGPHNTDKSFVFALDNADLNGTVFNTVTKSHLAIQCNGLTGPIFGGTDLVIGYNQQPFNTNQGGYTKLQSYSGAVRARAGTFLIMEIEVFQVITTA